MQDLNFMLKSEHSIGGRCKKKIKKLHSQNYLIWLSLIWLNQIIYERKKT